MDNETTSAHDVANDATIEHVDGYGGPGGKQTDALDGDKGGTKSMAKKLPAANSFMHGNFASFFLMDTFFFFG